MTIQADQMNAGEQPDPLVRLKLNQIRTNADGSTSIPDVLNHDLTLQVEGAPQLMLDEVFGRSLHFSGPQDAVEITGLPPQAEDGFALAIWVKPGQTQERAPVVSMAGENPWLLRAGDRVEFLWWEGNEWGWQKLVSPDPLVANTWTHVAVSINREEIRLFINGTFADHKPYQGGLSWPGQPSLHLGRNQAIEADLSALQHILPQPGVEAITFSRHAFRTSNQLVLATGGGPDQGSTQLWDANTARLVGEIEPQGYSVSGLQFDAQGSLVIGTDKGIVFSANPYFPGNVYRSFALPQDAWFQVLKIKSDGSGPAIKSLAKLGDIDSRPDWLIWVGPYLRRFRADRENMSVHDKLGGEPISVANPVIAGNYFGEFFCADDKIVSWPYSIEVNDTRQIVFDSPVVAMASNEERVYSKQSGLQIFGVFACEDGGVHIAVRTERYEPELEPASANHAGVVAVAFSPNGQTFATASTTGEVWLWATASGQRLTNAAGDAVVFSHDAPIKAVAFSPDGKLIATAGGDAVRLWNVSLLLGSTPTYQGDLSSFRFYPGPLAQDEIEAALLQDLPEIQVGTIFPLDFSLHNNQQQHVLYLIEEAQQLHLDVTNVGRRNVLLPVGNGDGTANGGSDPIESTLEIHFRPGTLKPGSEIVLVPPGAAGNQADQPNPIDDSANWLLKQTRDADGSDVIHLERKLPAAAGANGSSASAATTLIPGETLYLTLGGLVTNTKLGSHSTRVQLIYRLHYDDHTPLSGSRLHYLRVLNMSDSMVQKNVNDLLGGMEKKADSTYVDATVAAKVTEAKSSLDQQIAGLRKRVTTLEGRAQSETDFDKEQYHLMQREYAKHGGSLVAGIVGAPAILNDGSSTNTLRLCIDNRDPGDPAHLSANPALPPTFKVYLYNAANLEWSLLTPADLGSVPPEPAVSDGWYATKVQEEGSTHIEITKHDTAADEKLKAVVLTLPLKCSAATGTAYVVIKSENVGEQDEQENYFEGWLRLAVERTPILAQHGSTLAAGSLNLIDRAYLGFHQTDVQEGFDASKPESAISINANGALQLASQDAISLYPGGAVPGAAKGLVISDDDGLGAHAALHAIEATGSINTAGAMSAVTLTVTQDILVEGNVGTAADLGQGWSSLVPRGAILMWAGDEHALPAGWALCDGTHGTPDLRSRFVVGVGPGDTYHGLSAYTRGTVGGADKVGLTKEQMPAHDHGWTWQDPGHQHTITGGLSAHTTDDDDSSLAVWAPAASAYSTSREFTNIEVFHMPEGKDGQHENRPPYYALYYIMKL